MANEGFGPMMLDENMFGDPSWVAGSAFASGALSTQAAADVPGQNVGLRSRPAPGPASTPAAPAGELSGARAPNVIVPGDSPGPAPTSAHLPSEAYQRLGIPQAPFHADVGELEKRYAGPFGSSAEMMSRIAGALAAPDWTIKQKSPFGPLNQFAVIAPLDDGRSLVVRTQWRGDGYAIRAAYPLDAQGLARMISGASRAGAEVAQVEPPAADAGPEPGNSGRADDAAPLVGSSGAGWPPPASARIGGAAPPNPRPPDPGGGKLQASEPNGAPSGAVFVSGDPRAGNAVNRLGYGDEPTGVPLLELGRPPVERVLEVIDKRLNAYRNAPTATARDRALDEAETGPRVRTRRRAARAATGRPRRREPAGSHAQRRPIGRRFRFGGAVRRGQAWKSDIKTLSRDVLQGISRA